jgi:hypothetical protein
LAKEEFGTALSVEDADDKISLVKSVLDQAPMIRDYLKAVEEWAYEHMKQGGSIPGYKLVRSLSNRKFKFDEAKTLRILKKYGFGKKDCCTEPELLSPAQLEKVVGAKIVNPLCIREMAGLKLVDESDKREAIKGTASTDFLEVGDVE